MRFHSNFKNCRIHISILREYLASNIFLLLSLRFFSCFIFVTHFKNFLIRTDYSFPLQFFKEKRLVYRTYLSLANILELEFARIFSHYFLQPYNIVFFSSFSIWYNLKKKTHLPNTFILCNTILQHLKFTEIFSCYFLFVSSDCNIFYVFEKCFTSYRFVRFHSKFEYNRIFQRKKDIYKTYLSRASILR